MSNNSISQLPSTAEIYEDNLEIAFKSDRFNQLVNTEPKQEWIKKNPYANNSNYIPIGTIETLLQKIFKKFRVEVLESKTMFNSVAVTVRLHYWNGIDNTWTFHDGVGAVELQTRAESGTLKPDFSNINKGAVMMALPMAKSYAIKDACDHIGKLFGRDLNRKDTMAFEVDKSMISDDEWTELHELYNAIEENLTEDEKINAERIIKNKEKNSYNKLKKQLKNKIK